MPGYDKQNMQILHKIGTNQQVQDHVLSQFKIQIFFFLYVVEKEGFEKSQQELQTNLKQAEDILKTVHKLVNIGRNLKEEVDEKTSEIENLKEELKKIQESAVEKTTTEQGNSTLVFDL